jgi:mannosyltransferase
VLVVHPHLHRRRTGVTRHVETVVQALKSKLDIGAWGSALSREVPRTTLTEVLRRSKNEPVVWHAHRNLELLAGLLTRWLRPNLRVIYTRHAASKPTAYTRWLAKFADERVVLTAENRALLPRPVTLVGHGVDAGRFAPSEDRALSWRALGLPGTHGVGVVGRIRPEKGQGDFLHAFAGLAERFPQWTPVLIGRVKSVDESWLAGQKAPLGERLILTGELPDVVPWYQALSVVVQPSHQEGFGLVLLEAMSAGCCVIAAKLPHYEGILEHGVSGLFYPVGDVASLGRCLEEVFLDPRRARALGDAARLRVQERWSVSKEAEALAELYARAAKPR